MANQTEDGMSDAIARSNGSDSAFPGQPLGASGEPIAEYYYGLTKRELFAAMAMQGLAPTYAHGGDFMEAHVANGAVKLADALLKELAK